MATKDPLLDVVKARAAVQAAESLLAGARVRLAEATAGLEDHISVTAAGMADSVFADALDEAKAARLDVLVAADAVDVKALG